MKFRPCIDLKDGVVTQIVGGSLVGDKAVTNFIGEKDAGYYAEMYCSDNLDGGHIIRLGGDSIKNHKATIRALNEYPKGLQVGGGINLDNARMYLEAGASHVIVTSFVFKDGELDFCRLNELEKMVGKKCLVLDLSCRRVGNDYIVVTDRWQKFTELSVKEETLNTLSEYCEEFLIHGVDVEGMQQGIENDLVRMLGDNCKLPCTYAGGVRNIADLELIKTLGKDHVDATIGSALDIFGGPLSYAQVLEWNNSSK